MINTLQGIIDEKDYSEENKKVDQAIAKTINIKNFMGDEELRYDKNFEMTCIALEKFTNKAVKQCTTKEYFTLIQYANKQNKNG